MDILLAGGAGYLMDAMIDKLHKEGHRVYILSGSSFTEGKYNKAFEQYDFPYDSEVLQEILESVNPEAVIFFGAYDTNYSEGSTRREIVSYSAGLTNLLMVLSTLQKKVKFLYLSHEKVYQSNHDALITEEEEPNPNNEWEQAIRQGELACMNFQVSSGVDAVVLRLDHVYGKPHDKKDIMEPFNSMIHEALLTGKISANESVRFSMLSDRDAVQYIYSVLQQESHWARLYHLSSENLFSEADVADLIIEGFRRTGQQIVIERRSLGHDFMVALSAERYRDEFGGRVFDDPKETIPQVAAYIKRYQKRFYKKEEKEDDTPTLWKRISNFMVVAIPYLENMLFFIPFFMLNNRATGSQFFSKLDFYLLYVLLFAIVFGQQQATFSAILATAGYIFRQQYLRSSFEVILDYNTYVWIAQIFILGLVVGYLKDRLRNIRGDYETEIDYLKGQLDDIAQINTANVHIKGVLETQIINQNDSFGKVYEITSSLDQYEPEEVLFYATEVVSQLIHSDDVAIYSVSNRDYARLFASTSATARSLGNSIEYQKFEDMYEDLKNERVYINKNMDDRYPLMANGVFSEGKLELIIMIWGIPWDRMNLSQANMLRITSFLIQNAVVRANRYMVALENERYREGTDVLETKAFTSLLKAYLDAEKRHLTESSVLLVDYAPKSLDEASKEIVKALRNSDYMGQLADGNLYLLLSNTAKSNAGYVIGRMEKMGFVASLQEDMEL